MRLQQRISAEVQAEKIGKSMNVIIDRQEGEYLVGRTEFDSPEVDPEVLLSLSDLQQHGFGSPEALIGQFLTVVVTDSDDFDLYASPVQPEISNK